jgi:hypothetical protein
MLYIQSTGELFDDNGALWGVGYSGKGEGVNNPAAQHMRGIGPLPTGTYTMGDAYDDPARKGPCVIPLTPAPSNNMLGRSGFLIHGDNKDHTASRGCIILGPVVRRRIAKSQDRQLRVVAVPAVKLT